MMNTTAILIPGKRVFWRWNFDKLETAV